MIHGLLNFLTISRNCFNFILFYLEHFNSHYNKSELVGWTMVYKHTPRLRASTQSPRSRALTTSLRDLRCVFPYDKCPLPQESPPHPVFMGSFRTIPRVVSRYSCHVRASSLQSSVAHNLFNRLPTLLPGMISISSSSNILPIRPYSEIGSHIYLPDSLSKSSIFHK